MCVLLFDPNDYLLDVNNEHVHISFCKASNIWFLYFLQFRIPSIAIAKNPFQVSEKGPMSSFEFCTDFVNTSRAFNLGHFCIILSDKMS